jgi:hypothetical protein
MQPPFLIKTPCRHFYTETIHKCSNHEHIFQDIQCKTQDINTYQKTPSDATTERGAHFHPTIVSTIPNGFTTSDPRARPRCFETQSLTSHSLEVQDEGYFPSPLLMTHRISWSSSGSPPANFCRVCVSVCMLPSPPPFCTSFLLRGCVWHEIPCLMVRSESFYGWVVRPIPSFTLEEPPHLLSGQVIHF